MTKAQQTSTAFLSAARAEGFVVTVKNPSVVSVSKSFTPGDKSVFTGCDMIASSILDKLGARGGSMWGTDGGSVGGAVALKSGNFSLNVSGVSKRVTTALSKLLERQ